MLPLRGGRLRGPLCAVVGGSVARSSVVSACGVAVNSIGCWGRGKPPIPTGTRGWWRDRARLRATSCAWREVIWLIPPARALHGHGLADCVPENHPSCCCCLGLACRPRLRRRICHQHLLVRCTLSARPPRMEAPTSCFCREFVSTVGGTKLAELHGH